MNKKYFLFVVPVARVLANGNRTIETVTKRYLSKKITHLKVPVQHVLDVYIQQSLYNQIGYKVI